MTTEHNIQFFDSGFPPMEQIPRTFTVIFETIKLENIPKTRVFINGVRAGDEIVDNSKKADNYRFHDVFHYAFAAILGWSPCARSLMKRKRKSDDCVDQYEDGARATITEEAISLTIFNQANKKGFYQGDYKPSQHLLKWIREMVSPFEVNIRSNAEWEMAILKAYELFINLVANDGGTIHFDLKNKSGVFKK